MTHVTHDTPEMVNIVLKFSIPSFMAWECRCFEDFEDKDQSVNFSIKNVFVCRTATATQGLLNIQLLDLPTRSFRVK